MSPLERAYQFRNTSAPIGDGGQLAILSLLPGDEIESLSLALVANLETSIAATPSFSFNVILHPDVPPDPIAAINGGLVLVPPTVLPASSYVVLGERTWITVALTFPFHFRPDHVYRHLAVFCTSPTGDSFSGLVSALLR